MTKNFKSIFDIFRNKMKNPYKEWIERERNLGNPANNLDKLRELFTELPGVKQTLEVKPAPVKLIPLEGVLKNSQGYIYRVRILTTK